MTIIMIVLGIASLFCLVRGALDIRQRRYALGAIGLLCAAAGAAAVLLTPIPSHAVKLELPQAPGN